MHINTTPTNKRVSKVTTCKELEIDDKYFISLIT